MTVTKEALLKSLKAIRDFGPTCPQSGICRNFEHELKREVDATGARLYSDDDIEEANLELVEIFCKWPLNSGSDIFPVPDVKGDKANQRKAAMKKFLEAEVTPRDMWNVGIYAAYRVDLLAFCIDTLADEIANENMCTRDKQ